MNDHVTIAEWIKMPQIREARGNLVEIDFSALPFLPRRIFYVSNVPAGTVRGEHAHREGQQIIFCLSGAIEVELRSGNTREFVVCTDNGMGLLIHPGTWSNQSYVKENSLILVVCSHAFTENSYVGDQDS